MVYYTHLASAYIKEFESMHNLVLKITDTGIYTFQVLMNYSLDNYYIHKYTLFASLLRHVFVCLYNSHCTCYVFSCLRGSVDKGN